METFSNRTSHSIDTKKRTNRAKAIRLKCIDCCGYQLKEVRLCPSTNCPLWRYRTGKEEHDELYHGLDRKKPYYYDKF